MKCRRVEPSFHCERGGGGGGGKKKKKKARKGGGGISYQGGGAEGRTLIGVNAHLHWNNEGWGCGGDYETEYHTSVRGWGNVKEQNTRRTYLTVRLAYLYNAQSKGYCLLGC